MFTRSRRGLLSLFLVVLLLALDSSAREPIKSPPPTTQAKIVRARDLGIPFEGTPGKLNAITDVPGVEVGNTTLISGEGKLQVGKGPVRTVVTAIIPRGPTNRYAWASRFCATAFLSVRDTCVWPTRSSNVCGRYFLAKTS